jgi:hypothetical protein
MGKVESRRLRHEILLALEVKLSKLTVSTLASSRLILTGKRTKSDGGVTEQDGDDEQDSLAGPLHLWGGGEGGYGIQERALAGWREDE